MATPLVAVLLVALVAACSLWVLQDAQARAERRRPVIAILFGYTIGDPVTWAVLCLVGCVVFVPMYLVARRARA